MQDPSGPGMRHDAGVLLHQILSNADALSSFCNFSFDCFGFQFSLQNLGLLIEANEDLILAVVKDCDS